MNQCEEKFWLCAECVPVKCELDPDHDGPHEGRDEAETWVSWGKS